MDQAERRLSRAKRAQEFVAPTGPIENGGWRVRHIPTGTTVILTEEAHDEVDGDPVLGFALASAVDRALTDELGALIAEYLAPARGEPITSAFFRWRDEAVARAKTAGPHDAPLSLPMLSRLGVEYHPGEDVEAALSRWRRRAVEAARAEAASLAAVEVASLTHRAESAERAKNASVRLEDHERLARRALAADVRKALGDLAPDEDLADEEYEFHDDADARNDAALVEAIKRLARDSHLGVTARVMTILDSLRVALGPHDPGFDGPDYDAGGPKLMAVVRRLALAPSRAGLERGVRMALGGLNPPPVLEPLTDDGSTPSNDERLLVAITRLAAIPGRLRAALVERGAYDVDDVDEMLGIVGDLAAREALDHVEAKQDEVRAHFRELDEILVPNAPAGLDRNLRTAEVRRLKDIAAQAAATYARLRGEADARVLVAEGRAEAAEAIGFRKGVEFLANHRD